VEGKYSGTINANKEPLFLRVPGQHNPVTRWLQEK